MSDAPSLGLSKYDWLASCLPVLGMALLGPSGQAQVWEKKALCLDAARKMVRAIEAEAVSASAA